ETLVQTAAELIRGAFSDNANAPSPGELVKALESALDMRRDDWPTGLCRRLWEVIDEGASKRLKSPAQRNRWYYLAGFCLRPGFGDPLDHFRVEQLWKFLHAPAGVSQTAPPLASGADAWIMWRRVAGGLSTAYQQTLFDRLRPFLLPGRGKS